ncbi:MAG: AAA family ATPase [Chloroflexota bacterium]
MIPLKLSVKNFLSYRDNAPTLNLEGVHVACLCGDNGHGKSALLDAITWALWGTARARVQEELVFQGENEMRVDLEFRASDGRYRVARRFARAARGRLGTTFLELFHATEDGWVMPEIVTSARRTGD